MRTRPVLATVGLLAAGLVTVPLPRATADPLTPVTGPVQQAAGQCDDLDQRACLLPFPNDTFTTLDPSTPTGRRVDLSALEMPRNAAGKPIDPTEWNRNDGFSPGSPILTFVPGLDLTRTFGLDRTPETGVGSSGDPFAQRDAKPDAVIEDPARSMAPDAPIVLLDADTGKRWPYWAELDENKETLSSGADRTLIIRPLRNLAEGHRYIVALRDLRDHDGATIPAGPEFRQLRGSYDAPRHPRFGAPADIDPADRAARYRDIFRRLSAKGVDVSTLYLAWDFHVASAQNLAGRALAIRDDAFAQLGDHDLGDGVVEGASPAYTVTSVSDDGNQRTVEGTVTVPNYLTTPQDSPGGQEPGGVGVVAPQSRLYYGPDPLPGPMATPQQNPAVPTTDAEFVCRFRTDLPSVTPMLYGHGLLGSRNEATGSSTEDLRRSGYAACGVDWIGMATEDAPNVAAILTDASQFPSLPDRTQQGFLNFLYVGRALIHPDGLSTDPAFQVGGHSVLDTSQLVYDGNSQGGILGGGLTALAPDFTRSVLGVPGMNYSTLLNRSSDWEGEAVDPAEPGLPAYASVLYTSYPDKVDQQLVFALLQMLWDRGEADGYAAHMTTRPYADTPAHHVMMEAAFGDYQVANAAAEVEARTIGADFLGTALAPGRHWDRAYATGRAAAPYGLRPYALRDGVLTALDGSGMAYWDSGNPTPPNGNTPPVNLGQDPHSDPRKDDTALLAKLHFFETGWITDVNGGSPDWTQNCPRHPDHNPGC